MHCFASDVHVFRFVLRIAFAHIALLCLEVYSIVLPCICQAHFCWQYFALHAPRILFPWQCVALHCHYIDCIPFAPVNVLAGNSSLLGPRC